MTKEKIERELGFHYGTVCLMKTKAKYKSGAFFNTFFFNAFWEIFFGTNVYLQLVVLWKNANDEKI